MQALPYVPVPGGNIFLSSADLTTPETPDGRKITCRPIGGVEELKTVFGGLRLLSRLAG